MRYPVVNERGLLEVPKPDQTQKGIALNLKIEFSKLMSGRTSKNGGPYSRKQKQEQTIPITKFEN